MQIDISDILKDNGKSMDFECCEVIGGLNKNYEGLVFDRPVYFDGCLYNINGIIKLDGRLKTDYTTECYRCLKRIERPVDILVNEQYVKDNNKSIDDYTYCGEVLSLDQVVIDSILLSLPMKFVCSDNCKGLCSVCGADLNIEDCGCKNETINEKMEVLKDFFKDKKN